MTEFLIYIIRWAVVLTMLYSLYGLFMKRETLHSINRLVLLVILVAAMLLPLCRWRRVRPMSLRRSVRPSRCHLVPSISACGPAMLLAPRRRTRQSESPWA